MTRFRPRRVLILSPSMGAGGNATAALSLAAALPPCGVEVETLDVGAPGFRRRLREALRRFRPDVVHALHARKGAAVYLDHAPVRRPPLVTSLTGTDVFVDPEDAARRADVLRALRASAAILSDGRAMARAAAALAPDVVPRIVVSPQGFVPPPPGDARRGRSLMGLPRSAKVLLLPAGLRPVKDPLFAVEPVRTLRREGGDVHLVHCGEALDDATAAAMAEAAAAGPGVVSLGEVKRELMGDLYAAATVVLNTSRAEGLSNVIGEAQAAGRAVLVSDIPANGELVRHGVDGLLYRAGDGGSFLRAARRLLRDPVLRRRLGRAGRALTPSRDPAREAEVVAGVYADVMTGVGRATERPRRPTPVPTAVSRRRPRG